VDDLVCVAAHAAPHAVRDGPGILPDSSLATLRRRIRFETGPASCPTTRSRRFAGRFEGGPSSCPTARSRRFDGWFGQDGHGVLPGGSHDNYLTGKIRKGIRSHTRPCGPEPEATRPGRSDNRIRPMVSRTAPFPQLIAGFKSRPHVSPWLQPRGLYPQQGSYPCRPTCCPSDPSYLTPRLSSPSRILPSPSRSTVVSLAALRRICTSADGATHARRQARWLAYIVSVRRIV